MDTPMNYSAEKNNKKQTMGWQHNGRANAMPVPSAMPKPLEPPPHQEEEKECGYCITLAMAYVPPQKWNTTYQDEIGFSRGTIFPELDLPFLGEGGQSR